MATRADGVGERHGWVRQLLAGVVLLCVVAVPLCGVVLLFASGSGWIPWFSMTTAWEAKAERPAAEYGNGAWLAGDTLVRSRFDAVTGYDVRHGTQRWQYVPPGRSDVCAVSTAADGGVALVVHGELGSGSRSAGPGCATVAAIDLADGRELWHMARTASSTDLQRSAGLVATGGGLGVVLGGASGSADGAADRGGVRSFDLRTGTPRWSAALPSGCSATDVASAPTQVLAVLVCAGSEQHLAAFDPADGKPRWDGPLEARRGVSGAAQVHFLAADPPVLQVAETGRSGLNGFLAFGPTGRPRARIDLVGDYGRIPEDRPAQVAVADGRLFAVAEYKGRQGNRQRVVAFDLAGGGELWRADLTGTWEDIAAVHAGGKWVTAITVSTKYEDELYVLDARSGDEDDNRSFRDEVGDYEGSLDGLLTYRGLVIAVRWSKDGRPVSVYERW
ncbi:hypothetical protein GCM10023235_20440 [Kitasatospora terrestris]|uniref:Pyrrolo-quinoline quinone repeat domain-containing protein n=2 Tax=Kitasatospora terrestris TaxID=258051 RepID=A0ABP9DLN6_9ACTN